MRILILGTGGMAAQHARHFAAIDGVSVVAGVDVDPVRLEKFNATHGIPNGFASLDAAIAWGEFDAVANVTPDSIHHATSIAALKAGKHVFCEKPLATDAIRQTIREMNEIGAAIAHAVSGQEHATERTACNLRQAWQSSAEVANGIVGVARRASESSEASAHALAASTELVRQAEKLSSEAESFLATVRAA